VDRLGCLGGGSRWRLGRKVVVSRCWVLLFRILLKALHTEEDGEESDGLFVWRWDRFGKHLLVLVVDLLLNGIPS
jgi:hypothetical protein